MTLGYEGFLPTTAHAAVEILKRSGIELAGRRAVVVGRSNVVGKPAALLLLREHATVTICHSQTDGPRRHIARTPTSWSSPSGNAGLITGEMLQAGRGRRRRRHQRRGRPARGRRRLRIGASRSRPRSRPSRAASGPVTNAILLTHLMQAAQDQAQGAVPRGQRRSLPATPESPMTATARSRRTSRSPASVTPRPILDVARELGFARRRGRAVRPHKAKVTLEGIRRLEAANPRGKYVVVTGDQPTPLGEGKSTTTVGLAQGLNRIGKRAAVAIRQPSLGPVFGIKGGAAGGGYSQVIPMEDFNLHLTGDVHAIGAAHNLAAAFIDNHVHHGNALADRPATASCGRGSSTSATGRCARSSSAWAARENGYPRQTQFVITVALRGHGDPRPRLGPRATCGPGSAGSCSRPAATARRSPPRTSRSRAR